MPENLLERSHDAIHVMLEVTPDVYNGRVSIREFLEVLRQVLLGRHARAFDENGDNGNLAIQRRRDLNAHGISLVKESRLAGFVPAKPLRPDDDHQRARLGECFLDMRSKIHGDRYRIDIHENGALAKGANQILINPTGNRGRIRAPV